MASRKENEIAVCNRVNAAYKAFRLGKPLSANPYNETRQPTAFRQWAEAWMVAKLRSKEAESK